MSLFKTRELWSTSLDNDLFDLGCLKVANVGSSKKNCCSIITGSYNGFLRIYSPSFNIYNSTSNTSDSSFRAHDLVSELALSAPIVQIETGKFVSTSKKEHIAVLLPKKLIIYEAVAFETGSVEHGNQYNLKFIYEHTLQRTSYNMCKGSFGGVVGGGGDSPSHDYLCVQSMDGMLSVFEYESHSLTCFLPKCLLPGPIKYVPHTDSFITVSSAWNLESYKYQSLALTAKFGSTKSNSRNGTSPSKTNKDGGGGGGDESTDFTGPTNTMSGGKRVLPDYSYNMGEAAIDIQVHGANIVVLGERSLFCFTDTCALKFMKKFDYNPSAFCVYGNTSMNTDNVHYLITTHSKLLYVHQDARVKWAAQLEHIPVQVCVARLNDLEGCIVTLCEDGRLKCAYLGTEPALLNPIVDLQSDSSSNSINKFDFGRAEAEYRRLQGLIKTAIVNTGSLFKSIGGSNGGGSLLTVSVNVPSRLDERSMSHRDTELRDPLDSIPSLTVRVSLRTSMDIAQQVKVTVVCALPIVAVPDSFSYAQVASVAYEQEVVFYMKTKHVPASLEATVCASYLAGSAGGGVPRITETKFSLPLKLVAKSGQQLSSISKLDQAGMIGNSSSSLDPNSKSNSIDPKIQASLSSRKITIDTNRACVNLVDLFPELSGSYAAANGNAVSAQFYGHAHCNVSIQAAKSGANRYRLQCDANSCDYLTLMTREFVSRLEAHFASRSQHVEFSLSVDQLPLDDLKLCIDRHLELRHTLITYKEAIEKCCVQFRAIQKRLLLKFKDKSPTSLDNMDALLEATYRHIITLSDNCISTQKELNLSAHSLNCTAAFYVVLIGLAFKLGKESVQILEQIMTSKFGDTADLGWEEIVTLSVANMLKIALTKSLSSKDQSQQSQASQFKLPEDSSKLEKQLKSFIARLQSGSTIELDVYRTTESHSSNSHLSISDEKTPSREGISNSKSESSPPSLENTPRAHNSNSKLREKVGEQNDWASNEKPSNKAEKEKVLKQQQTMRSVGISEMPTFEDLMQSDEFKGKNQFNFDSDDD